VRRLGPPLQRQHGPEVTAGEALRYLAELPWAPHAPLCNRDLVWRELDDTRVEVATTVRGRRLAVELALDERPVCRGAMAPLPVSISPSPVRLTGDHPRKEHAMRYVMLIHQGDAPTPSDDDAWTQLSPDEQQQIGADYQAINETPGVTPGLWMQPPGMATTVRVQHGKTLTTDGPYVSVKEALGGYFILEADDLDAAIVVASRVPAARLGGAVEVRPVVDY
jgi:hypothetical protein